MAITHMVGIDKLCSIMAVDNEEIALATCNLFQCINDSLTGGDKREYGKEEALVLGEKASSSLSRLEERFSRVAFEGLLADICSSPDASKDLKTILLSLLEMVGSKKVSGHGRDQALNLLSKNVPRSGKKEQDNSRALFTIDHGELVMMMMYIFVPGRTCPSRAGNMFVFGPQV